MPHTTINVLITSLSDMEEGEEDLKMHQIWSIAELKIQCVFRCIEGVREAIQMRKFDEERAGDTVRVR